MQFESDNWIAEKGNEMSNTFVGHLSRPSVGNHLSILQAAVEASPLGVGLFFAEIGHDRWCAVFHGGACNCDPDVSIERWKEK